MMTVKEIFEMIKDDAHYAKTLVYNDAKDEALDYLKAARRHIAAIMLYDLDRQSVSIKPATKRQKQKYTYHHVWKADAFAVAMNKNCYGIDIEEGKEYTSKIIPWGILTVDNIKYPVYSDDPGQSDYIFIDGERCSAGSYNFSPETTFLHEIMNHYFYEIEKEIKGE